MSLPSYYPSFHIFSSALQYFQSSSYGKPVQQMDIRSTKRNMSESASQQTSLAGSEEKDIGLLNESPVIVTAGPFVG